MRVLRSITALAGLGFLLLPPAAGAQTPGEAMCGEDTCPVGYDGIWCRPFPETTEVTWPEAFIADYVEFHLCTMNEGAADQDDLLLFMRLELLPGTGRGHVTVPDCSLTIDGKGAAPPRTWRGGPFEFTFGKGQPAEAQAVLIQSALPPPYVWTFTNPALPVAIACDFEVRQ